MRNEKQRKKLAAPILIAALLCCMAGTASAANGDLAGYIYSTDIRAYINGVEVPSYNIGGRTVVVVEDITDQSQYNDALRVLTFSGGSLSPRYLTGGEAEQALVSGNIVGSIYKTDIKTYYYDTEIPSYNLGGKTAVALEDLGGFFAWNGFGGRYFYDDEARTIKLETLYENSYETLLPVNMKLTLGEDREQIFAELYGDPYSVGGNVSRDDALSALFQSGQSLQLPIVTITDSGEKQLGWFFGHKTKRIEHIGIEQNGELLTNGYVVNAETDDYKDVYELQEDHACLIRLFENETAQVKAEVSIPELSPREQVIRDKTLFNLYTEQERFETEDYLFVYAIGSTPHGGNTHLLLIRNDGTYHDYREDFEAGNFWGTLMFGDVRIDRENEACYFRAFEKNYGIDFKTGELTET